MHWLKYYRSVKIFQKNSSLNSSKIRPKISSKKIVIKFVIKFVKKFIKKFIKKLIKNFVKKIRQKICSIKILQRVWSSWPQLRGGVSADFWVSNEIDSLNFQHMLLFWFREASQNLSLFRQLFFIVSKGKPKEKCWKIAIIGFSSFFLWTPPWRLWKKVV